MTLNDLATVNGLVARLARDEQLIKAGKGKLWMATESERIRMQLKSFGVFPAEIDWDFTPGAGGDVG